MSNFDKKISVIIPAYNEESNIERCLNSLKKQSYTNIEIIVVDDGSTDNTKKIVKDCAKSDSRIKLIEKKNGGQSSARNKGLEIFEGEMVAFVDADDWISSEMFSDLMQLHLKYGSDVTEMSYRICSRKDESKEKKNRKLEKISIYSEKNEILTNYLLNGMKKYNSYPVWNKIYSREILKGITFVDDLLYEDILFNFEVLKKAKKYVVTNKIGYFYYNNCGSTTRKVFLEKNFQALYVGREIEKYTCNSQCEKLKRAGNVTLARRYFMCLCTMIKYGVDEKINIDEFVKDSFKYFRKNYFDMVRTKMPLSRKLFLTLFCISTKINRLLVRIAS